MTHIHTFIPSDKKDYEVCTGCGSYHSTAQVDPKIIYEGDYWDTGDGKTGRSTIEQQVSNFNCIDDCGISKADRVMQFVPDGGKMALEIAASPGVILKRLTEKGYEAFGIEPNIIYIDFICRQAPEAKVIHGYFPQVFTEAQSDIYDVIVGCDIYEHMDDGHTFIMAIHRLLKDGGTAILMSPVIYENGVVRSRDFVSSEHAYIYTRQYLEPYLGGIFSEVKFSSWILGHEIIICTK